MEVGVTTTCSFTIITVNSLTSDASIEIDFPNSFSIGIGSAQCPITGSNLQSLATCTYSAIDTTI